MKGGKLANIQTPYQIGGDSSLKAILDVGPLVLPTLKGALFVTVQEYNGNSHTIEVPVVSEGGFDFTKSRGKK